MNNNVRGKLVLYLPYERN